MSETQIGGEGLHRPGAGHQIHLQAPNSIHPVHVKIVAGDTVESIREKATRKEKRADSPDLAESQWLLWWAASGNQFTLQSTGSGGKGTAAIGAVNFGSTAKSSETSLVILRYQNQMMEIGVKVLNAWGDSLRKEAAAIRRELRSDSHRQSEEARGRAGHAAYLRSLTPEQRHQVLHHSQMERLARIDEGISLGLSDYLAHVKADPNLNNNMPFMLGTLSIGAPMRFDYASGSHVAVGGQTLVNPVGGVADHVLPAVIPTYSVELGAVATMFGVGTVYFTMGQTVAQGITPTQPAFTHKFAHNYAHQVLKTINGSEFNTLAMAMVTVQATEGEPLSRRRQKQLVNIIKVVMLSSALILLYKLESSFKGQGGGISSQEFANIVNGNSGKKDLAAELGDTIRDLLGTLPKAERNRLFAALQAYVDTNPRTSSLINLDAVFSGVGREIVAPDLQG